MTAADRDQRAFHHLKHQVLQPGETIYWTGRPTPKLISTRHLFRVTVGVFLLAFSVSWTLALHGNGGSSWMSGIFVLAAAVYAIAKPCSEYLRSHRTYYAITSRRVIIISSEGSYDSKSLYADDISILQRMDYRDGTGDIQLRATNTRHAGARRRLAEFHDGLWGVPDIEAAAKAVKALQRNA